MDDALSALCTDLVVMDPIVLTHGVDAIIAPKIGSTDSKMIYFDVSTELEDKVELRAVNQDKIVEASIYW